MRTRRHFPALVAAALVVFAPVAHAGGPPAVDARAYLVVNGATGEVLASRNAHTRLPIASITKLMTVLVATEDRSLDMQITADAASAAVGESTIDLRRGERLSLRDLVEAALIQSANDAADAIADGVAGDRGKFVGWMNAAAKAYGLDDTHFARPDGLDAPGHYSSAADVTRLAREAMRDRFIRSIVALRSATIAGGRTLRTWNDLLGSFPGLIGVKTGHTDAAGWCQVAAARANGVTVYATILGSPTRSERNADLAELLRWGLSRYRVERVITPARTYATVEPGYGKAPLALVAEGRARRSVRVDRPLVERVVAAAAVELPVRAGTRLGTVRIYSGRRLVAQRPLVAARSIDRPGVVGRIGFYARRTVKHIGGWFS
jgi:D-alanyl-D-alanine carboxypeptidase/D-alanyl-D-alanine carboxypeptidase (penicillin-binding protein 5/6)